MQVLIIVLSGIALFFVWRFLSKFKIPKIGSYALITGAIKTGKTFFAVNLATKEHKRRVFSTKVTNFFRKIFRLDSFELPLLYSNVPLDYEYVPLTEELITNKANFVYGSVVLISEASLVADSTTSKNEALLNEQLMVFIKLFGHKTHGGLLVAETQAIADLNVNFKKNLTQYFYIHHIRKLFLLPFTIAYVREDRYAYDGSTNANYNEDVEEGLKKVLCSNKVYKMYDRYCYSALFDHLPVERNVIRPTSLKSDNIVTFKKFYTLEMEKKDNEYKANNKESEE